MTALVHRRSTRCLVVMRTGGHEGVAALRQDLHQVVGEVPSGQVQTHDGVGQRVALVDGHIVGHTVARVQHNTWKSTPETQPWLLKCTRRVMWNRPT